jgi:hypothetical protein
VQFANPLLSYHDPTVAKIMFSPCFVEMHLVHAIVIDDHLTLESIHENDKNDRDTLVGLILILSRAPNSSANTFPACLRPCCASVALADGRPKIGAP